MEYHHKNHVQNDVYHRGYTEIIERPPGVSHRPQNSGAHVVYQIEQGTAEEDAQVGDRIRHNLFGRAHPFQDQRGQKHAQHDQQRASDQTQRHAGMHRPVKLLIVLRPVILGDNHSRAGGDSHKHADDQIDQGVAGTNCSQCLAADEVSNHDGIYGIIQLLKKIAYQKRHGKRQKLLPDYAFRHDHLFCLLFLSHPNDLPKAFLSNFFQ